MSHSYADKDIYKTKKMARIMNLYVHEINKYIYSTEFLNFIYDYHPKEYLKYSDAYLRNNIYPFYLKGSSAFVPLQNLNDMKQREVVYTSDFDCMLSINPGLCDYTEYVNLRMCLIVGILWCIDDLILTKLNEEYYNLDELCLDFDKDIDSIEIVNTGLSSDDFDLYNYLERFNIDNSNSLYKIKVLTNITNDITSHMLITIELKTKTPIHILDIVIPCFNSPASMYEWKLSKNLLRINISDLEYVSKNETYGMYICRSSYLYYTLDLNTFYIDQLYSSHFLRYKKEMISSEKYAKRFQRALHIQLNMFESKDLIDLCREYGDLILPNKMALKDLIFCVPQFYRILNI